VGATVQDQELIADVAGRGDPANRLRHRVGPARVEVALGVAAADGVGQQIARFGVGQVVAAQVGDRQLPEDVVEHRGGHLDGVVALEEGSKRVKVKASTYSSSGTPYCRPMEIAMAKLFIRLRKAAPSLCMSMKISPRWPVSYSPVLR
jgi:hypothetical protein